jgi:hypothetical protein
MWRTMRPEKLYVKSDRERDKKERKREREREAEMKE